MNKSSFYVYVLYSNRLDKYYVGYTQNPTERLKFHNSEQNRIWTKRGQPWELKKVFEFDTTTQARKAENKIKKQRNRQFIERILTLDTFEV